MRRKETAVVGEPIRLASLDVLKRKVSATRAMASDPVGAVFNESEVAVLRRLAKGERIVGIDLTRDRAKKELAWISHGGEASISTE
jgi:hypothetical protein